MTHKSEWDLDQSEIKHFQEFYNKFHNLLEEFDEYTIHLCSDKYAAMSMYYCLEMINDKFLLFKPEIFKEQEFSPVVYDLFVQIINTICMLTELTHQRMEKIGAAANYECEYQKSLIKIFKSIHIMKDKSEIIKKIFKEKEDNNNMHWITNR